MTHWRDILENEIKAGKSATQIAEILGYSPTAVSLVRNGKYKANLDKFAACVMSHFGGEFICPYTNKLILRAVCEQRRAPPDRNASRAECDQWVACRFCPRNPNHNPKEA